MKKLREEFKTDHFANLLITNIKLVSHKDKKLQTYRSAKNEHEKGTNLHHLRVKKKVPIYGRSLRLLFLEYYHALEDV